jgi:hypothetical protein
MPALLWHDCAATGEQPGCAKKNMLGTGEAWYPGNINLRSGPRQRSHAVNLCLNTKSG